MKTRFWGVRGSIAVSGPRYIQTGGNTPCVEVLHEGHRLILDGGTGLRALGASLAPGPAEATVLFTHVHWDHIQGVPFFGPAFHPGSKLRFAGAARNNGNIQDALNQQMRPPTFPVGLDAFAAELSFTTLRDAQPEEIGPFRITPLDMAHPDGVFAYKIEAGGRSLLFATDVEHFGAPDRRLIDLATGTDLLIHDAQYTRAEYAGEGGPSRKGWGHSTWDEAVDVAVAAGVKRLALFHHDPERDDAGVAQIESAAQQRLPTAFAAREGHTVQL